MVRAGRLEYAPDYEWIPRKEFLEEVWDYREGEQVTVLAPQGGGKTQLLYELLDRSATRDCPCVVLVMKPRDKTVSALTSRMKLRTIRDWPPSQYQRKIDRPRGWVVWPVTTYNLKADERHHRAVFERTMAYCYQYGQYIVVADEGYSLEEELDLDKEIRRIHTKGRTQPCGIWEASQRAAFISKWAYQANHIFLGFDSDKGARQRLSEIGGAVDTEAVMYAMDRLGRWEFVYINRDERTMCVIGA